MQASDLRLRRWRDDPLLFVREAFGAEPDPWQAEVLREFPFRQRIAMKCAKGPGKTTLLAWCCWNFLCTRPHPKMAATSISGDNLSDNLWAELAKWRQRSEFLTHHFTWKQTKIFSNAYPETWFLSARTWPRSADPAQQADTLAGLHADFVMFVLDESGGIPSGVMAAAEAGLSTGVECKIMQAGNPTHLEGPLYAACTQERHLWHVVEVTGDPDDPMRSPRVSIQWAREQIAKYGRDNPWVLVNVFGRFPPHSINALIGPDEVREAMQRHYRVEQYQHNPVVLGVDVAREGDDSSVIYRRQGPAVWQPIVLRNVDSLQGAAHVHREWSEHGAHACHVDATGGFGSGWIDQLRVFNRHPVGVHFSGEPIDRRYANKRAEMYFLACQWVREGGALPDVPELLADLVAQTYSFKGDRLLLEPKEALKVRLGRSPDHGDGLALTFAYPVVKPGATRHHGRANARQGDYDPHRMLEDFDR